MPTHQLIWTEHDVLPPDLEVGDEIRYFSNLAGLEWRKVLDLEPQEETTIVVLDPPEIEFKRWLLFFTSTVDVSPSVLDNDDPVHVRRRHRVEVKGLG